MVEGLWAIDFVTNINTWGGGVLVLTPEGRILGGDMGYYYIGKYDIHDDKISGTIDIIQFNPQCVSVFGDVSNFELQFEGSLDSKRNSFDATAESSQFPGGKLVISGRKKTFFIL